MSDVAWDSEDYVPPPAAPRVITDKWEGEDEEDDVKESWEDDDENKDAATEVPDATATVMKKKKKKLSEIIAEKERKKQEELQLRQKAIEEEMKAKLPEEILAEKLRIQKIQEDADLQLATDLVGDKQEATSLDSFDLSTSSGLSEFKLSLLKKLKSIDGLEKRQFYVSFLEDLCRELCANLEVESIKKITTVLNALYNEKLKASKPTKGKKKAAGKAKLNKGQGGETDLNNYDYEAFGYDEYDDFI